MYGRRDYFLRRGRDFCWEGSVRDARSSVIIDLSLFSVL